MPLLVRCPNPACSWSTTIPNELAGLMVNCTRCGQKMVLAPAAHGAPDHRSRRTRAPAPVTLGRRSVASAQQFASLVSLTSLPQDSDGVAGPPMPPPELANHSQYEVVRELGRGGTGVVYLARHRLSGRREVLKVMNRGSLARSGSKERFLREIQAAARLHHPNIVKMYTALEAGDLLVLVMEYVEGLDLAEVVKRIGPLLVLNACFCVQQVALGLQHAFNKGMVHRDIKPQNLILAPDGERRLVKILDFGLAKVTSEAPTNTGLTIEGQMLGTPTYMAPEQAIHADKADVRADIYSLGCTLYFLLTGGPPFAGENTYDILLAHRSLNALPVNEIRLEIPEALAAVVARMMAKDPAQRYQKPGDVVEALAPFVRTGGA